jgi:hypothetical protein
MIGDCGGHPRSGRAAGGRVRYYDGIHWRHLGVDPGHGMDGTELFAGFACIVSARPNGKAF